MACEKYDELLQLHLDQSLGRDETLDLQRHLDGCSRCRRDLALYRKVFETLNDLPGREVPGSLTADVMAALETAELPTSNVVPFPSRRAAFGWAVGLAALVLLAVGFVALSGVGHGPTALPVPVLTANLGVAPASDLTPAPAVARPADSVRLVVDGPDVAVMRRGTVAWQPVASDVQLALGDRVKTGPASHALLYYRDCGRLKVLPGTDMQVLAQGVRVRTGSTWIKIYKHGTAFSAETPNAVASVRGTAYTAEVLDGASRFCVFEGLVLVQPGSVEQPGVDATLLAEGRQVVVEGSALGTPGAIPLTTYLAYNMLPPTDLVTGDGTGTAAGDAAGDGTGSNPTVGVGPDGSDVNVRPAEGVIDLDDLKQR